MLKFLVSHRPFWCSCNGLLRSTQLGVRMYSFPSCMYQITERTLVHSVLECCYYKPLVRFLWCFSRSSFSFVLTQFNVSCQRRTLIGLLGLPTLLPAPKWSGLFRLSRLTHQTVLVGLLIYFKIRDRFRKNQEQLADDIYNPEIDDPEKVSIHTSCITLTQSLSSYLWSLMMTIFSAVGPD